SVQTKSKVQLKTLLIHFSDVSIINLKEISWKTIQYQRNNETYRMLITICYFIIDELLLTTETGNHNSPLFSEENMNLLFERFVLNYYKAHYTNIKVHAPYIQWNLDPSFNAEDILFLPRMETDIVLHSANGILIIDTKFYKEPMTKNDKLN